MAFIEEKQLKRKRAPNWHLAEKSLLLSVVEPDIDVVENKKIDGATMRQKSEAWERIAISYNSKTLMQHRTALNLKTEWECLKKAAKKDRATRKMNAYENGGVPLSHIEDPVFSKVLSLIGAATIRFHNPCDFEADVVQPIPAVSVQEGDGELIEESQKVADWTSRTTRLLKIPISTTLCEDNTVKIVEERTTQREGKNECSGRRPVVVNSSIGKIHDKRLEVLELQRKHAEEEREEAKEAHILLMEMRREEQEKNRIEMEILRERLRQEKIKTRMLLIEKNKNRE